MKNPLLQRKSQLGTYEYILTVSYERAEGGHLVGSESTQIIVETEDPQTLAKLKAIAAEKQRNYRLATIRWGNHTLYRWSAQ